MKLLENLLSIHSRAEGDDAFSSVKDALRDCTAGELARVVEAASTRVESFAGISDPSVNDADTVLALADVIECANDLRKVFARQAASAERAETARAEADATAEHAAGGADEKADAHRKETELNEANDKYAAAEKVTEAAAEAAKTEAADDGDGDDDMARREHARHVPVSLGMLPSDRRALTSGKGSGSRSYSIVAAADIPNISTGAELDGIKGLSEAAHSRFQAMSRLGANKTMTAGIATIRRNMPDELIAKDENDWMAIERAFDASRLAPNALTAAGGGWCAPSEILYDLCPVSSLDGLLDHPTIQVRRGGLRWPSTPDFSSIYSSVGFNQTEAQAQAGTVKPCTDIPCPPFNEARMNALGLCIRGSILTNQAYPELTRYFVEQALIAHAHQVNAWTIAQMVAQATAMSFTGTGTAPAIAYPYGPGATAGVLGVMELVWQDLCYKYRFPLDMKMEVVAPAWLEPLIRSDVAKRMGWDGLTTSDARIMEYFAARNLRVQYVYDWQDSLANVTPTAGFGNGTNPMKTYPASTQLLIYPASTYIIGVSDVITIDGLYDSTNLSTNNYTAIFTEEGRLVGKRCFESRVVSIDLCPTGLTGGYPATQITESCPAA